MNAVYLRSHGFDLSTGYVYRDYKTMGTFDANGAHLNEVGMARLAELEAPEPAPVSAEPVKKPAAKKAAKKAEAPAEPAADTPPPADAESDLLSGLSGLVDD